MWTGKIGTLTLLGALVAMATVPTPSVATGAIVGKGDLPVPGCVADAVPLVARNLEFTSLEWRFDYGFGCSNPKFAFGGPWNPNTGGCLPYLFGGNLIFCIGAVSVQGLPVTVSFQLCQSATSCQSGTATVVRA